MAGCVLQMGAWIGEKKQPVKAEIEIKYSSHCYTEASTIAPSPEMWSVRERNEWRVFNVPRHILSIHLPKIIQTLVHQPNKQIQRVSGRHNFKIFQVGLNGLKPGEKYYAFIKLECNTEWVSLVSTKSNCRLKAHTRKTTLSQGTGSHRLERQSRRFSGYGKSKAGTANRSGFDITRRNQGRSPTALGKCLA